MRDRLYSLIEFALKCNLIFSEAVSSPSAPLPLGRPSFPSFQGEQRPSSERKEEKASFGLSLAQFTASHTHRTPSGLPLWVGEVAAQILTLPPLPGSREEPLPWSSSSRAHHEGRFFPWPLVSSQASRILFVLLRVRGLGRGSRQGSCVGHLGGWAHVHTRSGPWRSGQMLAQSPVVWGTAPSSAPWGPS